MVDFFPFFGGGENSGYDCQFRISHPSRHCLIRRERTRMSASYATHRARMIAVPVSFRDVD
jgi:hypothetical protein